MQNPDLVTIRLGSYQVIATRQATDPEAWLVVEMSGDSRVNSFAVTTKALAKTVNGILKNELEDVS